MAEQVAVVVRILDGARDSFARLPGLPMILDRISINLSPTSHKVGGNKGEMEILATRCKGE
jgi:hypothetical protein